MEPIERVLAVLEHKEADRVPLDLGSPVNGIHYITYEGLVRLLGMGKVPIVIWDRMQGLAVIDETILKHFDIDFRHVRLNPPRHDEVRYLSENMFVNEFGITFRRGGYYFDMVEELKPLYKAKHVKDIERYKPPEPHEGRIKGLGRVARRYAEEGYAVVADAFTGGIHELAQWLRGIANYFRDLYANPELAEALLDLTLEIHKRFWDAFLTEVGDYIHIVLYGDDYGTQQGLQMSPSTWRRYIKPRLRELISFIKKRTKAKFMLHSCGSVREIISDLIEVGVDILNPIQPRARGMNRRELKKLYGDKLVFHGGIDIQQVLPYGTPEEVEREVKDTMDTLAPGGGYIFSPAHNIQPDVPPLNVHIAYRAALIYGRYR